MRLIFLLKTFLLFYSIKKSLSLGIDLVIKCSPKSANILLLIDTSSNIDSNSFNDLTNRIIPSLIDDFKSNLSNFFLSIIPYSDKIEVMALEKVDETVSFKNRLNAIEKKNANSNHILALEKSTKLFRDVANNLNLCVWFTDGKFQDNIFSNITRKADNLKNFCQILTVNIGKVSNQMNLKRVSSEPRLMFELNKIDLFSSKVNEIFNLGCISDAIKKLSLSVIKIRFQKKKY
ncbi:unnamed protein product [Brachionus calyciflorus]|uniref:VWFA domain-containing protein n=1 Tax=Brachionus calyciflorus TaxID=104777 RepID=A0A813UVY7_9BILA|nr:unnamed protein product [Brachionus calyciflorus]